MQIKLIKKRMDKNIYTVAELLTEQYIGCIDIRGPSKRKLHLVELHVDCVHTTDNFRWVDCSESWGPMALTKEQAIIYTYDRDVVFYIFETKEELMEWKAGVTDA